MRLPVGYRPRRVSTLVGEALTDTRVVVVNGARQVGKSTLAEVVTREIRPSTTRSLDLPDTRLAADRDPVAFLRHDGLMLIDEVQRVPDLWLAIKAAVDDDPRPGQFLLTGSARLLGLRELPDSLIGRAETVELWPLSQGEIDGCPDGFIDAGFEHGADLRVPDVKIPRAEYVDRLERGGYPAAVARETPRRRQRFFDSYLADFLSRDIKQVADIERSGDMQKLMRLVAGQAAGLLRVERLANELSISAPTAKRYLDILETVFLIKRIPAWSSGATTRTVGTPKVMFIDSGLAAHLAPGIGDARLGGLLENFVLSELSRQLSWSAQRVTLHHYRDRDGREVDALLENAAGDVIGIEVKAAETVREGDFGGLAHLRARLGPRFRGGFVLYCGAQQLSFGDRLAGLPISALWTATPS